MSESEKVFLSTGSSLQHLEGEASRILAESARETGIGADSSGPAESLRIGLTELDQHLERVRADTEAGLSALSAILAGIEKLSRMDGDFQLIVATLHALASTTRLENSRQRSAATGFDSVVNDVRSMALRIKPKFAEVLAQSRDVRMTAESALAQGRVFLERQRHDVTDMRRDLRSQLGAMSDACRTAQDLSNRSKGSMGEVRASVGGVLQSLQVHDLARQMLEHVVQGLVEFADSAESVLKADDSLPTMRSWLAELAVVSELESAQLANASGRIVQGLAQIDRSLQAVVATLSALASESARFSGRSVGTSVFGRLERGIRLTTEALRTHDGQAQTMMRALTKVRDTGKGAQRLVDEVADLGKDARFIGLNAMVKAVRVGQAGGTLTVLAREIQTVSEQIQHFTAAAAEIMDAIGREVDLVDAGSDDRARGGRSSSNEVASRLEGLVAELGTYQSSLASAVEVLLSGSEALRVEVSETSQALHGLVEQAKHLRNVSYELANLHSLALVDARGATPPPGRAHQDSNRYTMEQERQIERLTIGVADANSHEKTGQPADAPSAEGSIEFF
jgi:hypothetical protein